MRVSLLDCGWLVTSPTDAEVPVPLAPASTELWLV